MLWERSENGLLILDPQDAEHDGENSLSRASKESIRWVNMKGYGHTSHVIDVIEGNE